MSVCSIRGRIADDGARGMVTERRRRETESGGNAVCARRAP
jgi:hypothetical protein